MAESYTDGLKTLWEKEKLLVTSNFSFSHSIFKRLVAQGRQKVPLCGNGLMACVRTRKENGVYFVNWFLLDNVSRSYFSPCDKKVDFFILKALANNNFCVTQRIELVFDRVENMVEKGEKPSFFSLFFRHAMFSPGFFHVEVRIGYCIIKGKHARNLLHDKIILSFKTSLPQLFSGSHGFFKFFSVKEKLYYSVV